MLSLAMSWLSNGVAVVFAVGGAPTLDQSRTFSEHIARTEVQERGRSCDTSAQIRRLGCARKFIMAAVAGAAYPGPVIAGQGFVLLDQLRTN